MQTSFNATLKKDISMLVGKFLYGTHHFNEPSINSLESRLLNFVNPYEIRDNEDLRSTDEVKSLGYQLYQLIKKNVEFNMLLLNDFSFERDMWKIEPLYRNTRFIIEAHMHLFNMVQCMDYKHFYKRECKKYENTQQMKISLIFKELGINEDNFLIKPFKKNYRSNTKFEIASKIALNSNSQKNVDKINTYKKLYKECCDFSHPNIYINIENYNVDNLFKINIDILFVALTNLIIFLEIYKYIYDSHLITQFDDDIENLKEQMNALKSMSIR